MEKIKAFAFNSFKKQDIHVGRGSKSESYISKGRNTTLKKKKTLSESFLKTVSNVHKVQMFLCKKL